MKTLAWLVCSAFMEKKGAERKKTLVHFLSPQDQETLSSLPIPESSLCLGLQQRNVLIDWVHPSWFVLFLRSLPQEEISLFLSVFSEKKANFLQEQLLASVTRAPLSPIARNFLEERLVQALTQSQSDLLPLEALPASSLKNLLSLTSKQISLLVECLGLYDLSTELRQIIDTQRLKKIYASLSKEKKLLLQLLTQKPSTVSFKRMDLSYWKGDVEELLSLIRKRGMNRLAKAFYPEQPSLVWHITRRMSTEEAHLFSSFHRKLDSPNAYAHLSEQVQNVHLFLQKHNFAECS